ncbi:hypothetical protein JS756_17195 [Streptomyces actuosus]|uniref:Sortase n=1 Tax=Streptomyces actuosus TaxID=1885 RepID=A0ABS2VRU4_STRAS|nr:hypothetical protein [Streptomyces actuosus]MBN0045809.1 hypothetical protein [Streptomyces actuosus]
MGRRKLTLCATAAALAAFTPTAYASNGGGVSVSPSSPVAGADVALRVSGCSGRTATAVSTAFVADVHLAGTDGTLAGETKVRSSIDPGAYDVRITCADFTIKGRITVVERSGRPHPAEVPESPVAPVPAGGGGTARLAASEARAHGPGTAQAVTGLVLAGVAAVAVALRSTRRSRRTD